MTTEPRQEAERIVKMVENELAHRMAGIQDAVAYRDRLVDALANAIEARDAIKWDYSFLHGSHGASLLIGHEEACEFNRALSALREDETWHAS